MNKKAKSIFLISIILSIILCILIVSIAASHREIKETTTRSGASENVPEADGYIITFNQDISVSKNKIKGLSGNAKDELRAFNSDFQVIKYFPLINAVYVKSSQKEINALEDLSIVKKVEKNRLFKATLDSSVPLINADDIWPFYEGTGMDICIVDTGFNFDNANLPVPTASQDFTTWDWCLEGSDYDASDSVTSYEFLLNLTNTSDADWLEVGINWWIDDTNRYDIEVYYPNGTLSNDTYSVTTLVDPNFNGWWAILNLTDVSCCVNETWRIVINETDINVASSEYPVVVWGSNVTQLLNDYYFASCGGPTICLCSGTSPVGTEPRTFYNIHATDDNGHGTHVAGTIFSTHPVLEGVAQDANLYVAKVLDSEGAGSTASVVNGIEWCVAQGADIISMSLGGAATFDCDDASADAVDGAAEVGVLSVVAAGNAGPSSGTIDSPGCARRALTIGATNDSDIIASFSSRGPVDGTELWTKPDVTAPGVSINSTYFGGFANWQGTSMATPHVSGVAALLKESNATCGPGELKAIIINSANQSKVGVGSYDNNYGFGRVDALSAINYSHVMTVDLSNDTDETINFTMGSPQNLKITVYWEENVTTEHSNISVAVSNGTAIDISGAADFNNTVKQVYIPNAAAGDWQLVINGTNVVDGPKTMYIASNVPLIFVLTTDAPVVTLNAPDDASINTNGTVTFSCTAYDDFNLENVTLYGNWSGGWNANDTEGSPVNDTPVTFDDVTLSDGIYGWNCLACDNESQCSFATNNYTLTIDALTPPVVTLNSPADNNFTRTANIIFNCSATDAGGLINITLYGDWGGWHENETTDVSGTGNSTTFSKILDENSNYTWNCEACDVQGNCNSSQNRTITIDTEIVSLNLISPADGNIYAAGTSSVPFKWNVSDNMDNNLSCNIFTKGKYQTTKYCTNASNCTQTISGYSDGNSYTWRVNCSDGINENISETRDFDIEVAEDEDEHRGGGGGGGGGGNITICGDDICGSTESYTTCPQDCAPTQPLIPTNVLGDLSTKTGNQSNGTGSENQSFSFIVKGKLHTALIAKISNNSIILWIWSEPIKATLSINEPKKIDVDGNGLTELEITFNSVKDGKADLTFKEIPETTTQPTTTTAQPAAEKETNWTLYIIIAAVAIVVILIIVGIAKRKK